MGKPVGGKTTLKGLRVDGKQNWSWKIGQVKCTLVQALRLRTGRTAHRWSRGIALPFLDHGTRRDEGSASRPGRSLTPRKTGYPLCRWLGGPQGRSGQVRKISPPLPTGIRSPDRPARSQSLFRILKEVGRQSVGWILMARDRDRWPAAMDK